MSITTTQGSLFGLNDHSETVTVKRDGLDCTYIPDFVDQALADQWFDRLKDSIEWRQDTVVVYGKPYLTPRLSCWMGESWMSYRYSNQTMSPQPWLPLPMHIKGLVRQKTGEEFNSVLINYYRDGQDSNGWHADDEPELGSQPAIASISLGAARDFDLRRKANHSDKLRFSLAHGSLLLMRGKTQDDWQHQIPKRAKANARINLTFRKIIPK